MAERVRSCWLCQPCLANGLFHSFLQHGFVQVMSVFFSGCPICVVARCRKYPLPSPLFSRIGIFPIEGVRQDDSAQAALKIAPVLLSNDFEVLSEGFFHHCGKHRVPIFVAFAGTHNYLVGGEIDIFDPQLQTLHQSQTLKN